MRTSTAPSPSKTTDMTKDSEDLITHTGKIVENDSPYILAYYDETAQLVATAVGGPHLIQTGLLKYLMDHVDNAPFVDDDDEN